MKIIHKSVFSIFVLAPAFFCVLFFSSCSARTETPAATAAPSGNMRSAGQGFSPEMRAVFANAGLPLLNQKMEPRDFTLPIAASPSIPQTLVRTISLGSLRGKVVFLNFWATWCPPCRDEMPSMESLYAKFRDRDFEILAVNSAERNADVYEFMTANNLSFPAVLDSSNAVNRLYGVQAIPTSYIIDRDGMIILRLVGSIDWDTPEIHAALELLF